jgi:hypothetical protein
MSKAGIIIALVIVAVIALFFLIGRSPEKMESPPLSPPQTASSEQPAAPPTDSEAEHHHTHTAPHGGTLVPLGDHFAHVELVLDAASGKLTVYVLDGEAGNAVRVVQPTLDISIAKLGQPVNQGDYLSLTATANPLTGEKEGDTSEFTITSEKLQGLTEFQGIIQSITIKDEELKSTKFKFPGGNE